MASEYDGKVVTLQVQEGNKPGQPIGSYSPSRRSFYLVFLPGSAPVGKEVKVKLVDTGKQDKRGSTLFRGEPAPVEYSERWKDNGDGTATKVTIATDWVGKQTEEGAVETRSLMSREDNPSIRTDRKVVWGNDLASTFVEKVEVKIYPQMAEQVRGEEIVWVQTGKREEKAVPEIESILRIKVWAGDFDYHKLEAAYNDTWTLTADCYYTDSEFVRENTVWGKLPAWLQAGIQAQYSICSCGRKRVAQNSDGYLKCEECRKEETCIRCGKKASVKNLAGRLVCDRCQPYESAEQLIETSLPTELREVIAAEAKRLLAGQALPQEVGETILKATLDHIQTSWTRDNIIRKWSGYGWYYFCEDGIYGTKLAPAALQILQFLPQATGNGLVEMVAWLIQGYNSQAFANFYVRTQVQGESGISLPTFNEDLLKQVKVAERLRGSESDRLAAIAGHKILVEKLGEDSREAKAVAEILQNKKQDYAAAIVKIREAEEMLNAAEKDELLINFSGHFRHMGENNQCDIWVIDSNGQEVEPEIGYRKRYTSEGDKCWRMVGPNALALRWSRYQAGGQFHESWEVVKLPANGLTEAQREGARRVEPHERFNGPGSGFDLSQVGMNSCSVSRDLGYDRFWIASFGAEPVPCDENGEPVTPEALERKRLLDAKKYYEANLARAKEEIASGNWIRLKFRKGRHPKTGEIQWEAGNKREKFVLDRYSSGDYEPVEGEMYYCSFGKVLVDTPTFRLQLVRLERPFPEDVPEVEDQSSDIDEVSTDAIRALQEKFRGN